MVKTLNRCNWGKASGSRCFGSLSGCRGLTRVEVTVIIVCIFVFALLALPALNRPRDYAQNMACASNVKQTVIAFSTWEGDHGDRFPMGVLTNRSGTKGFYTGDNLFRYFQMISNELHDPKVLACPADDRNPAPNFASLKNSNLSYFVGLDADETFPSMLLTGDRNLVTNGAAVLPGLVVIRANDVVGWSSRMHNRTGHIGLADGSVQMGSISTLQKYFNTTGTNVTRLAVP
jgi:competence protein ComGC